MEKEQPKTFAQLLPKILGILEFIAIVVSMIGVGFKTMHWYFGNEFLIMGLGTLAITLFQTSFLPSPQANDVLQNIVNKLGYIGSSVGIIGILFSLLHFNGAHEMIFISMLTLGGVVLATGFLTMRKNESLTKLKPMLMRGVPILLISIYFHYQLPPLGTTV